MPGSTDGKPLTSDQAWTQLAAENLGRLITSTEDGSIEVFPINYVRLSDVIMLRTDSGTMLSTITTSPKVVFEVDHQDLESRSTWSVVVHATAHIVSNDWARRLAASCGLHPIAAPYARHIVVLTPLSISGRTFGIGRAAAGPPHPDDSSETDTKGQTLS
ncbi:pyridoxamine 5'-phosphate oxidase family protein [Tsukamurella columbiensis]|uniref:Pyridoxamine 5'-phosphate oxidase family protein n=1 Tax=Tsukamurella columbiensis TaxID=128509 RepID=A0ABX1LQN7_9ACTN|nr:pyridoxamine 5'-phosphate oxidase family protein [Tsukamurella columbiensis]NMD58401.1 pyridoxamine 5'-phosphate oxidase family protein [Tsukamurella columbiensis]